MNRLHFKKASNKKGFTISELLVACVITVFTIVILASLLLSMVKSEVKNTNLFIMDSQSMRFISQFSKDIQSAEEVEVAGTSDFSLKIPVYDGGSQEVQYTFHTEASDESRFFLRRTYIDSSGKEEQTSVEDVTKYEVKYFDYEKVATDDPSDIRYVQVVMSTDRTTSNNTYGREIMTPLVMLRNKQIAN